MVINRRQTRFTVVLSLALLLAASAIASLQSVPDGTTGMVLPTARIDVFGPHGAPLAENPRSSLRAQAPLTSGGAARSPHDPGATCSAAYVARAGAGPNRSEISRNRPLLI